MSDQITLVCDGIAAVGKISGIQTAFAIPPAGLETAELAALYAFTGTATNDQQTLGAGFFQETRLYRVQVAVLPTGQGTPELRETRCRPLITGLNQALRDNPSLGGVAGVQKSLVVGDSGIVLLPEWGGKFIGFEIRLQVTTVGKRARG